MSEDRSQDFLQIDREDLLAVIAMRFGKVPEAVRGRIMACEDGATLERWLLVAANAPNWEIVREELTAGSGAFRLVGPRYRPVVTDEEAAVVPHQHVPEED